MATANREPPLIPLGHSSTDLTKSRNRASVNPELCHLCKTCIGDVFTSACFEIPSNKDSRWKYKRTPANKWGLELTFDFYEHPSLIEASSNEGCELCALISRGPWQHLVGRAESSEKSEPQMYLSVTHARKGRQKTYETIQNTLEEPWMLHCWMKGHGYRQAFFAFTQTSHRAGLALEREQWFLNYTGSDQTFECIKSWLSECTVTHRSCKHRDSSLPTRVVDVGPSNASQNPYLLETGSRTAPYIALSYCWGSGNTFITSKETIAQRYLGFTVTQLPQTLQDAVLVARKLHIRYLWIDAICIIQDDDFDWQNESLKMKEVFKNALFVISALDATHCNFGMFYNRIARLTSSDVSTAEGHGAYVREDPWPFKYQTPLQENSLGERAWALQERFVARAVLHFSRLRLCWECRAGSFYEDGTTREHHPITKDLQLRHSGTGSMHLAVNAMQWYEVVETYMNKTMTYNSDKLAAIAGLANEFQEQGWCQEYVAGMWKDDLLRGLLWQHGDNYENEEQFAEHVLNRRFPSWSWASSDTALYWDTHLLEKESFRTTFDSDFSELRVKLTNDSKTASTVKGSIEFKGYIALLSEEQLSLPSVQPWRQMKVFVDEALPGGAYGLGYLCRPTMHPCWIVRMATWTTQAGSRAPIEYETCFMLLEEVHEGGRCFDNTFRRVGTLNKRHNNDHDRLLADATWKRIIII